MHTHILKSTSDNVTFFSLNIKHNLRKLKKEGKFIALPVFLLLFFSDIHP